MKLDTQAKPLPVTPPTSTSVWKSPSISDIADDNTSIVSSVSTPSTHVRKFTDPDTWRPTVMLAINADDEAEKRRRLTPDVRNALVRDLVTTMYTYMPKPNKDFCTKVAKQLTDKYTFMRDAGTNVSGYVLQLHLQLSHFYKIIQGSCIFPNAPISRYTNNYPTRSQGVTSPNLMHAQMFCITPFFPVLSLYVPSAS